MEHVEQFVRGHLLIVPWPATGFAVAAVPTGSGSLREASSRPTAPQLTHRELSNVSGYRTFRQVAWAGSFEAQTTSGLGVRARLPFSVLTLDGSGTTGRAVVDVAHRW
ncbi:AMIN-like domain-containing (lipo)protein [Kribbella flavida]|uniref:AMIN-like domain-containing (lipo)protein n=1 Tax=Kribbella flavida TaxID=182640 RepID=UPI00019BF406|nr:hypothetical protein [Kribbella flavida]